MKKNKKSSYSFYVLRKQATTIVLLTMTVCNFQSCEEPAHDDASAISLDSLSPEAQTRFAAAKNVLNNNCASCHGAGGTGGFLIFPDQASFIKSGLILAGDPDKSRLIYRLKNYKPKRRDSNMPPDSQPGNQPGNQLSDPDYAALRTWIENIDKSDSSDQLFACEKESASEFYAQRLSRDQYLNSLDFFLAKATKNRGVKSSIYKTFADFVPSDNGVNFNRDDKSITGLHYSSFINLADEVANIIIKSNLNNYLSAFTKTTVSNSNQIATLNRIKTDLDFRNVFIRNFLTFTFRRPPIETADLNEVIQFGEEIETESDAKLGLNNLIFRTLMAPQFIYQVQLDTVPSEDIVGSHRLSSAGMASRISYALTNSPPSEELMLFAQSNDLYESDNLNSALNLIENSIPKALDDFTSSWLHLDRIPEIVVDGHLKFRELRHIGVNWPAEMYQLYSEDPNSPLDRQKRELGNTNMSLFNNDAKNEILELVKWAFIANKSIPDLLTTDVTFAREPQLLKVYGIHHYNPAPPYESTTEANALRIPASEPRSGVLTRAAMLISGNHEESPILRGAHIRQEILCLPIPPPPPGTDTELHNDAGEVTTRTRVADATSVPDCIGCHSVINPLGFALSNYNSFGGYQISENYYADPVTRGQSFSIDARDDIGPSLNSPDQIIVNSGVELSAVIAESDAFKKCFTGKFHSYLHSNAEQPANQGCALNRAAQKIEANIPLKEFIFSLVNDISFKHKQMD